MVKEGARLALWLNEDGAGWREVGAVTITLNTGGSPSIAMSHFRVLDTSGGVIDVGVDRMRWAGTDAGWPK